MKASRFAGAALLAVVSLLVVLPAGAAFAAKTLALEEAGTPVADGSPAAVSIGLEDCGLVSNGSVAVNNAAKDKLTASSSDHPECPVGLSISGLIREAEVSTSGKAKLAGTVTISKAGPCVYEFTKWKGSFGVPGFVVVEGSTSGKLAKALSSKTKGVCASKDAESFYAVASSEAFGEPFEAVVLG